MNGTLLKFNSLHQKIDEMEQPEEIVVYNLEDLILVIQSDLIGMVK